MEWKQKQKEASETGNQLIDKEVTNMIKSYQKNYKWGPVPWALHCLMYSGLGLDFKFLGIRQPISQPNSSSRVDCTYLNNQPT